MLKSLDALMKWTTLNVEDIKIVDDSWRELCGVIK